MLRGGKYAVLLLLLATVVDCSTAAKKGPNAKKGPSIQLVSVNEGAHSQSTTLSIMEFAKRIRCRIKQQQQ